MSPIKRKVATRKSASRAGKPGRAKPQPHVALLVGTRKGAFIYHGDPSRTNWTLDGPHFLGHIVNHFVLDPRDTRTMLIASKTGHLGPTIFRSLHMGRAWEEANKPPAFGAMPEEWGQRSVDARTSQRAQLMVGRHLASGSVSQQRWRHDMGGGRGLQSPSDVPEMGSIWRRYAGRIDAAMDHHRSGSASSTSTTASAVTSSSSSCEPMARCVGCGSRLVPCE